MNVNYLTKKHFLIRFLKDLKLFSEFVRCYNLRNRKPISEFILNTCIESLILYAFDWEDSALPSKTWSMIHSEFEGLCYDLRYCKTKEMKIRYLKSIENLKRVINDTGRKTANL